jgi:nicotinamide riboside kinase
MQSSPLIILSGTRAKTTDALVVNIFGGPGTGKSTLAAQIFAQLKMQHIEAACPEEHAKLAIWSGQPWLLDEQAILLGRTWETLSALVGRVDVVICDSPLLLCSVYAGEREPLSFHNFVIDLHKRTHRLNLFIERPLDQAYSTNGRRENEDQALVMDQRIKAALRDAQEPFLEVSTTDDIVPHIRAALPMPTTRFMH